ncbi:hypothetical protein [Amycolatopsis sp. DSM 110486]|uniref:hypothetical protein n=1 Tax=Amycolatopsis sp. DSM 110486 TaxID=2865832 RepID=UPI001C6977F8|nr:hypothetical protein [Amycolatopsis sp. DSM 110486]QYN21964.1 hypothetical protein K1T34_05480 [Amycolatopsis sp. DSM 110486]
MERVRGRAQSAAALPPRARLWLARMRFRAFAGPSGRGPEQAAITGFLRLDKSAGPTLFCDGVAEEWLSQG